MKRKIIKIDEALCDGCGDCVVGCSEGAIQIIDGKAKLVREDFCDGFGDCIGVCHSGALVIEERETVAFDEEAVKENLLKTKGKEAVWRMEDAQARHKKDSFSGCPGMQNSVIERKEKSGELIKSELEQWPVQLHLVNPAAPFLKNKELVLLSTCSPVASPEVHSKYMKGRGVLLACPKLDRTDPYVEKLASIFNQANISKLVILRMEVPCCAGLTLMVKNARELSGRSDLIVEEHVLGIDGTFKGQVDV